eukprot:4799636-Pleurochrysis_carterae.AAC.1
MRTRHEWHAMRASQRAPSGAATIDGPPTRSLTGDSSRKGSGSCSHLPVTASMRSTEGALSCATQWLPEPSATLIDGLLSDDGLYATGATRQTAKPCSAGAGWVAFVRRGQGGDWSEESEAWGEIVSDGQDGGSAGQGTGVKQCVVDGAGGR